MNSSTQTDLTPFIWQVTELGEILIFLAHKARLLSRLPEMPAMPTHLTQFDEETLNLWLDRTVRQFDLEVEPITWTYSETTDLIRRAAPALLQLPSSTPDQPPQFLALLKRGSRKVSLITRNLSVKRVDVASIQRAICAGIEAPFINQTEAWLKQVDIQPERQEQVRTSLLNEYLSAQMMRGCWIIRLTPGASVWQQIKATALPIQLSTLIIMHFIGQMIMLLGWWFIGRGALQGYFEWAWLYAWALLLLTGIPFQIFTRWVQSRLALTAGLMMKRRLLAGILKLKPEEIRHEGIGQFLSRTMESSAFEGLILGGGFTAIVAVIELITAGIILYRGSGGGLHVVLFALWGVFTLLMAARLLYCNAHWVATYRHITNDLVERMVGHRTRLAQEDPDHWHDEEDQILANYLQISQKMDAIGMQLNAVVARGWLILGLVGVAYTFVINPQNIVGLAITLGGTLYASQALGRLVSGISSISALLIAWQQVGLLFQAAARTDESNNSFSSMFNHDVLKGDSPLLVARELVFRYREWGPPTISGSGLHIYPHDRLLLEGPSGGGKSTLAALLVGLRMPESGLLLLRGFDRYTISSEEWRRRVVSAPQFHENHILTETFSFNLLMGRRWPPEPEDLAEAEAICHELGLGELLQKMPAGFQQMLGESGWQLSHGERSRLYIARALLQKADLIVLDESFAALDPKNLSRALTCVLNRAPALLVIAHP